MSRTIRYWIVTYFVSLFIGSQTLLFVIIVGNMIPSFFTYVLGSILMSVINTLLLWGMFTSYQHCRQVFRSPLKPLITASVWGALVFILGYLSFRLIFSHDPNLMHIFDVLIISIATADLITWQVFSAQAEKDEKEAEDPQSAPPDDQSEHE